MFKSSKSLLVMSVLVAVLAIMFAGCYEKAQPSSQAKTETKSSLAAPAKTTAPAEVNAPACKAAVKKECKAEKKVCPKKAGKKHCPLMAEKKGCHKMAMDANDVKHCPMKDKKACPPNCKMPCCAKKAGKCKAADANAPADKPKSGCSGH